MPYIILYGILEWFSLICGCRYDWLNHVKTSCTFRWLFYLRIFELILFALKLPLIQQKHYEAPSQAVNPPSLLSFLSPTHFSTIPCKLNKKITSLNLRNNILTSLPPNILSLRPWTRYFNPSLRHNEWRDAMSEKFRLLSQIIFGSWSLMNLDKILLIVNGSLG